MVSMHPRFEPYLGVLFIGWPGPNLDSIYFFYFGLTALAVASGVYALRCPPRILTYADVNEWIERELERQVRVSMSYFLKDGRVITPTDQLRYESPTAREILRDSETQNMTDYYKVQDLSRTFSRRLVLSFYGIGFSLIVVPPARSLWNVFFGLFC